MPYYVASLHPRDWTSADTWVTIPEAINGVVLGGGNKGAAGTFLTGAGQPSIYGAAVADCFFAGPVTTVVVPATADPPFPPVYPYMFSTGDIYGRNNLNQNLKFVRNDDYTFDIVVTLNGAVLDITGTTIRMTAKWAVTDADNAAVFSLTTSPATGIVITDATNGKASVTIDAAKTAALPAHTVNLFFDIQIYFPTGVTKTVMYGSLTIVPDISVSVP